MNKKQFESFVKLREKFEEYTAGITGNEPEVIPVYNDDLNIFTRDCEIKYILIADNPGKEEAIENRYLIGHAGKQARNFFAYNELVKDFKNEVMVLNKTCIHTKSTSDLRKLKTSKLLSESQNFMAELIFDFHKTLNCDVWIIGCSEIKSGGIFSAFKDSLTEHYITEGNRLLRSKIFCYKHFSYGNFSHDLKSHPSENMRIKLNEIGSAMRENCFGW